MAAIVNSSFAKFSHFRSKSVISAAKKAIGSLFSTNNNEESPVLYNNEKNITKSVFISQSNDIFTNLALEDWFYRNNDFTDHHVLLLWRNNPCVVIGRHQNPWLEANLEYLAERGIVVARRNSGGGTVFHDRGNLNLTFFTPVDRYSRKSNLEVIKRAMFREFNLTVNMTERDDLLYDNYYKVSGTASRLGHSNAYHHCTLLIDAQKASLGTSLHKSEDEIETNASKSVPAATKNLREVHPYVTPERTLTAVGWEFLRTTPLSIQDGGNAMIARQRGFHLINPTDKWFPGLGKKRQELQSWDWIYGRTPDFTAKRGELSLKVQKGIIQDLSFRVAASSDSLAKSDALSELRGQQYTATSLEALERAFAEPEPRLLRALQA